MLANILGFQTPPPCSNCVPPFTNTNTWCSGQIQIQIQIQKQIHGVQAKGTNTGGGLPAGAERPTTGMIRLE